MGKKSRRVSTSGGESSLDTTPFGDLNIEGLPQQSVPGPKSAPVNRTKEGKNRGRVDVVRQRSGGGGGWVTIAKNFVGISVEEKTALKKSIQKRCGVGGSLKGGQIEIQGDKREEVKSVLEKAGFRVVFAGG